MMKSEFPKSVMVLGVVVCGGGTVGVWALTLRVEVLLLGIFVLGVLSVILVMRGGGTSSRAEEVLGVLLDQKKDIGELQGRVKEMVSSQGENNHRMFERFEGVSQRLTGHLHDQSQQSQTTLGSLREALTRLEEEQKRMVTIGGDLKGDVGFLRDVLSNRPARGAYGEIRLNAMVMSVLPASMVEEQKTLGNGKKVDCLIKLPEPTGAIPVDAKFPLEGFQRFLEAEGTDERKEALKQCGRDIRTHVDAIAEKYLIPGETADIALMFIPSEAVFGDIHAHLESVVDYAWRKRVFMVSPTTMMAVLASMRAMMRHATSHEQALEVQKLVGGLRKDVERLGGRIGKLDKHFSQVLEDVREMTTSKDKILRHSEKIEQVELMAVEGGVSEGGVSEGGVSEGGVSQEGSLGLASKMS